MRLLSIARGIAALGFAATALHAAAQEWPTKPVRFINPFGAGGLIDTIVAATRPGIEARLK
ncbi:MAG: hypothetical protein ACKO8O_11945 [Betaproteobacteria bacterium]